jgi:porphyrinogen peroxidase
MPASSRPVPQAVVAPLTRAVIFLTLKVQPKASKPELLSFYKDLSGIVRAVDQRGPGGDLTCIAGFGSAAWDALFGKPRPAELHEFKEVVAGKRRAVSTPGDLFFHIRAQRMDLCFELSAQIMGRLDGLVTTVDEVQGFRYFDNRDLIGFVDGTENPRGDAAAEATLIGREDPGFEGGSYVITQKYLHNLKGWNKLDEKEQERIVGRTKLTDIELDDSVKPKYAHNALTKVVEHGKEVKILRDNMSFGEAGKGQYGTFFIGYCRTPRITEEMIRNMFVGKPPGNYDKLLDYSEAVTGCLFFVPSATFLDGLGKA